MITRETALYASIAARPGSFGVRFFNHFFKARGIDAIYKSFAVEDLLGAIRGIRALGIRGCAVSMPHKEKVLELLDDVDPLARRIGAVNTIVSRDSAGSVLAGYNTDVIAVQELLQSRWGGDPSQSFCLLGSGGMARAVAFALRSLGRERVRIVSRNAQAGPELAAVTGYRWQSELGMETADVLINATPIGMEPDSKEALSFPISWIEKAQGVMDAVALPSETRLIQEARRLGKSVITGAELTLVQGREQFRLYTGITLTEQELKSFKDLPSRSFPPSSRP